MGAEAERSLRRWKCGAAFALTSAGVLLAVLVVTLMLPKRSTLNSDERLIGTWQSDADRTIAGMRARRQVDEKQEAALRKLFGKLRVTYSETTIKTELDGVTESSRYEILGGDKVSVVIREGESKPSPLEVTEFAVIHFDGPDSYWLYTKIGGIQEYFERVK